MPILRINSAIERYRYFARPEFNIHAMAGHGEDGLPNIRFVSTRILTWLKPDANDVVVDVGCGDGHLLAQAAQAGATCIGVIPTKEERARLEAAVPDIDFKVGRAQALPLDSGCASKIVCNSVLVLLEDEENVRLALREIGRVARPGAQIWLGEVPAADELADQPRYWGKSVAGMLLFQLRFKGTRAFLASLKAVARSAMGSDTLLLDSCRLFHATPPRFIQVAADCGLKVDSWFKHTRLELGAEVESRHRYNYLCTKATADDVGPLSPAFRRT